MSTSSANQPSLRVYAAVHALILAVTLFLPKIIKSTELAQGLGVVDTLLLLIPDLLFILALELALVSILTWGMPRINRAIWGLLLLPIILGAVIEHRFYLATGSILDLQLLMLGLKKMEELKGVISSEIPLKWWVIMISSAPISLGMAYWGAKIPSTPGRPKSWPLHGAFVVALGLFFVSNSAVTIDPRVISLQGNLYLNLAQDLRDQQSGKSDLPAASLEYPLEDPVSLKAPAGFEPKNVVVVVLESVRSQSVTAYAPELDTMPYLGKLAAEGLVVDHAYTVVPHTTKSLVPILCGVSPDIRQALTETTPSAIPTPCLPQLLSKFGYASAFFQPATQTFEQRPILVKNAGFQHFVADEQLPKKGFKRPNYLGVEDNAMIEPILEWVDGQEEPFFLSVLTLITHHNYKVPPKFKKKTYAGVDERTSNYYNTLRYSDMFLETLMTGFEERGLFEDTLFIFVGDHGEGHGEHGKKGHDEIMYQEGIQVPLILWSPSMIETSGRIDGLRQHMDIAPTVVEMLGLEIENGAFSGRSLMEPVDDRVIFTSCWYRGKCMGRLEGDDKFIYYYGKRPNEFFNLKDDPWERENLASTLEASQTQRYIKEMEAWRDRRRSHYATHLKVRNSGYIFFEAPEVANPLTAKIGKHMNFLGYESQGNWKGGEQIHLDTYFEVLSNVGWHWRLKLALIDSAGKIHNIKGKNSQSQYPAYTWVPGQFRKVDFDFKLPKNLAPGPATLRMRMQGTKSRRMKVTGEAANEKLKVVAIPLEIQ